MVNHYWVCMFNLLTVIININYWVESWDHQFNTWNKWHTVQSIQLQGLSKFIWTSCDDGVQLCWIFLSVAAKTLQTVYNGNPLLLEALSTTQAIHQICTNGQKSPRWALPQLPENVTGDFLCWSVPQKCEPYGKIQPLQIVNS